MKKVIVLAAIIVVIGLVISPAMAFSPTVKPTLIAVDKKDKSVTFAAVAMSKKWEEFKMTLEQANPNYDPDLWHLVISATQVNPAIPRVSMFAAWAGDHDISDALASLGAKADTFDVKTWTDRMQKDSPFPDMKPQGTHMLVYITWNENGKSKTVEANDILESSTGKKLDFVFLGKQFNPSHCVVCLYGCVGGRVANASLTVRDYIERGARWNLKKGVLPPDGTPVLITLKLK